MKKLSDGEKLTELLLLAEQHGSLPAAAIDGLVHCPYGNTLQLSSKSCPSCSKLDGSECVDEFLAALDAWDAIDGPSTPLAEIRTASERISDARKRVDEWRKGQR